MHPGQYAQVKALFAEVCDLVEPARSARLEALCDEPEIIAEVQALISQTGLDEARFATPVLSVMAAIAVAGEELKIGDRVGVWTLTRELGHGGMGTVFQAQRGDGQFQQISAIKVLRGIPNAPALERLAQERQIVANLAHPNIARLLDGGATPKGQPYLVLEYIEGTSIDHYCQQHRLGSEAIVEKILSVCAGLSYAHQRLVVHCDLKPSNIMVTHDGRPLLLDFGIAQLMAVEHVPDADKVADAKSSPTGGKALAYTPGYASPEQRAGAVLSTATDVYGLGRVLQELLTLSPSAERTQLITEFRRPSVREVTAEKIQPHIAPALRAIIAHATAEYPANRYISISAFAQDLQRYLRREAVSVLHSDRLYRARCFLRRNVLALSLTSVAVFALVAGLIGTSLSLQRARVERTRAEVAAARATRTADFLGNILSAADPDRASDLDTKLLREILDQAATQSKRELANEPLVLSQIEQVIGNTYYQLGAYEKASSHLKSALDLRLPAADYVRERLILREKIADSLGDAESAQALQEYQAIYDERVSAFGRTDPETLRSAHGLAFQEIRTGRFKEGLKRSNDLQPMLETLLGATDATTLANLQNIAIARTELAQFAAAETTLKSLIARNVAVYGQAHSKTFAVQNSLVIFYLRQSRFAEAEQLLREVLPIAMKQLGANNFKSINFAGLLGSALRQNGKLVESGVYYRQALESASKLYGAGNGITLRFENNYANFELANGEPNATLLRLARIEPLLDVAIGPEHPDMSDLHRTRAKAQTQLKQLDAARASWQRALAIDRKAYGDDKHPLVLDDLAGLAALSAK